MWSVHGACVWEQVRLTDIVFSRNKYKCRYKVKHNLKDTLNAELEVLLVSFIGRMNEMHAANDAGNSKNE